MSGLLGGVLPAIFSQADRAKRYIGGLLADPVGRMQQAGGQAVDDLSKLGLLSEQAFNDPRNPMKLQDNAAARQLTDTYLNSVLNFAPVGVTVKGPQAEALEKASKNAVKMLGLPENNTPMDRAKALGFVDDTYHGTFSRFDNFDVAKANPRSQYMPGVFTADNPALAENYGDYVMPLLQKKGATIKDVVAARNAGLPKPVVDTIHDKSAGIRVTDNPLNIRSRFAAFDPARINENDLLGRADPRLLALIGLGAGGAAYYGKDK